MRMNQLFFIVKEKKIYKRNERQKERNMNKIKISKLKRGATYEKDFYSLEFHSRLTACLLYDFSLPWYIKVVS